MKPNYEQIEDLLEILLAQDKIGGWRELTKGQYRIDEELDIFPKSKKWFRVSDHNRGHYTDLERFIRNNV